MFRFLLAFLFLFPTTLAAEELTLERLYGSPSLGGDAIEALQLSPDGSRVTYLKGKDDNLLQLDLWEYNIADGEHRLLVDSIELLGGEEVLSEEEKARRERQRIRAGGIVTYFWDAEGRALLFPLGGDIYYKPLDGDARQLTATEASETDMRVSPQGSYVSFIRERDLFIIDLASGEERQLTFDGEGAIANGVAEFVAQEEMDRDTGYWWALDESKIAFTKIDESPVHIMQRYEIGTAGGVTVYEQRYPLAGTDNVLIDLGVVDLASGDVSWLDLGDEEDIYLTRVNWTPDSATVAFQRQSRDQQTLDLIFAAADGSSQTTVLTESADHWLNLTHDLTFLEDGRFLWTSERSGYRHIYLYNTDGSHQQLTEGDWVVSHISGLDEAGGMVYFEGFQTVLEQHLYGVSFDGGEVQQISEDGAWHSAVVSGEGGVFIDTFSSDTQPSQTILRGLDGSVKTVLLENALDENHPYYPYLEGHAAKEFGTLEAEDGSTLHYSITKPADFDPEQVYPAIVFAYGGPGVTQRVRNTWAMDFNQYLARQGYIVFTLDNRGTKNRGSAFEAQIYKAMGGVEVTDQVLGTEYLKSLPYVDADNVGFWGWSYGGYMALNLMFKAPGTFKAAFSGAPVTKWELYDTHYTERYMGHPIHDAVAYEGSSVFPYVGGLDGDLLVMHGMADDNVFFDHTVTLIADLQKRGLPFELMTYPGERHGIYNPTMSLHRYHTAFDFFERKLKGD